MRNVIFAAIWFGAAIAITNFAADALQKWRLSQVRSQQAVTGPQDLPYSPPLGHTQQVSGLR